MKNIFITMLAVASVSLSAQLRNNTTPSNGSINTNTAFLDASSSVAWNGSNNNGKGLVFPRTDLVAMTALAAPVNGIATSYPTRLDGMIVYNTATGTAGTGTAGVSVVPGFYYYDNKSATLNGGTWKPFTSAPVNPKLNILTTETITNTLVNSAQVYAIKGQFTASGTTTAVNIPAPAGITAMYAITIYKAGTNTVYDRSLYSYDTTSGNAITGSPNMSVVYPNGTYDYVLEYLK